MMQCFMELWDHDAVLYGAVGQWDIAVWRSGAIMHRCMGLWDHDASLYGPAGP